MTKLDKRQEDDKLDGAVRSCDPLLLMPGHKLSKMIKEGSLSSAHLCKLYIEHIRQVQPKINCMAEARFERALVEAQQIDELVGHFRAAGAHEEAASGQFTPDQLRMLDSPLLGVPLSVKESIQVEGMLNSCGLWKRRDVRATSDAVVVANARRAGLVPICTTNIPELTLFWADCRNPVYGRARNPYDSSRVTGASSGGEAGLIGAAGSLMGIGSDIGGSLRIPAHYCGIYSHKPSPFLLSPEGNWPALKEARLRMFTLGPMSRYASDLRHLLRILMDNNPALDERDKRDESKTDETIQRPTERAQVGTNSIHQPKDLNEQRARLAKKLDDLPASVDLSQVKVFFSNFKRVSWLGAAFGQRETHVQSDILEAQRQVVEHFVSKFNCQSEEINIDRYLGKVFRIWHSMLLCGATIDHEQAYEPREAERLFGISSVSLEILKWFLGISTHTKEAILTLIFGMPVPRERARAFSYCEKFERLAQEMRLEVENKLGPNGVLILPTLPTVAHKHHRALLKTEEVRFPSILNVLQFPATHATIRLDKKHKLPFGLTLTSRPYNDHLTLVMAEEIESVFGGWTLPERLIAGSKKENKG